MILPVYYKVDHSGALVEAGSFDWEYRWVPGRVLRYPILQYPLCVRPEEAVDPEALVEWRVLDLRMEWIEEGDALCRRFAALLVDESAVCDLYVCERFSTDRTAQRVELVESRGGVLRPQHLVPPLVRCFANDPQQQHLADDAARVLQYQYTSLLDLLTRAFTLDAPTADTTPPEESKPLAPLPDWLAKVDEILDKQKR